MQWPFHITYTKLDDYSTHFVVVFFCIKNFVYSTGNSVVSFSLLGVVGKERRERKNAN